MGGYFRGWYFKCQSEGESLALIPALHRTGGRETTSLQLITGRESWTVPLPAGTVSARLPRAELGWCRFSERGLRLDLHTSALSAVGALRFGPLTPLRYDIMGPFAALPFLECRHRVASMGHRVAGVLTVNGKVHPFHRGLGYIEGDRGRSFPREYLWTQSFCPGGSLMLAVADIPLGPGRFTGVIGAVRLGGREYRLATYLGARVLSLKDRKVVIRQGALTLAAQLLDAPACPLKAPAAGAMTRTIRENVLCRARYRLRDGGRVLLDVETDQASFEYEYPR